MADKPKILILDIETAPAELWGWGMFKQNFGVEQVKEHPYILCVGYQWLGEGPAECLTKWELGEEVLLRRTRELLQMADLVIGKNSARFDLPWLNTEFLKNKIPSPGPITQIDLEKVARFSFRFLSNKLEYIVDYVGVGQKMNHEGFPLWRKVMEGNEAARKKMVRYCKRDVSITGRLYKQMRSYIHNHPFMGTNSAEGCAVCGSPVEGRGWRRTQSFMIQKVHCLNKDCGAWRSGRRVGIAKWIDENG